jgi:hypothetical protein
MAWRVPPTGQGLPVIVEPFRASSAAVSSLPYYVGRTQRQTKFITSNVADKPQNRGTGGGRGPSGQAGRRAADRTSGWQYRDWRGTFYPPDLPVLAPALRGHVPDRRGQQRLHRLPAVDTFRQWANAVPADFSSRSRRTATSPTFAVWRVGRTGGDFSSARPASATSWDPCCCCHRRCGRTRPGSTDSRAVSADGRVVVEPRRRLVRRRRATVSPPRRRHCVGPTGTAGR